MKHRVGVIGSFESVRSARRFIPEDCELAALCDIRDELLQRCRAEDPDVFCTADYRELARRGDVDTVVTFTPNETHRDIAVAMLEGGKNVFIEKPMGISLQQGREILAAEKASAKYVGVDLEMHVIGMGPEIKAILDSGEIGGVLHVEFDHARGGWLHTTPSGEYRTRKRTGGLMRMEGIHQMNLFRLFAGEITAVQSFCAPNALPHYEIPDNITVMVWFKSGALGRYTLNQTRSPYFPNPCDKRSPDFGHSIRYGITGTRGSLFVDVWRTYIDVYRFETVPNSKGSQSVAFVRRQDYSGRPDPMGWFYEDLDGCRRLFLERMAAGLTPLQRAADAFRSEQVAWAAEKSSFENGQRIEVPLDWQG